MNFPFFVVLFEAGMLTFFKFMPRFYFSIRYVHSTSLYVCSTTLHGNIRGVILTYVCRLLFYTIHRDKDNNNNGMRHETARVDRTIDSTFHQNGSDGKRSTSCSYGRKVWHQAHFPPPFCFFSLLLLHLCLLLFITYYTATIEYLTIMD